jgi:uncharacterized Ntn-hydrolase superfamily protein
MTYSIVARDPKSGELGIAVQSRYFAAGRLVPGIEAGVGVIASQASANASFPSEGLRLLRSGFAAQEVLQQLIGSDGGAALRQVAVLDRQGNVAVHTGASCVAAAGHRIGVQCSAQANMMVQPTVWPAMLDAYERGAGDLAERLLQAMQAAEREGGDLRGRQAAALIVVAGEPSSPPRPLIDLRVDDHADPVAEIKRQLAYSRAHQRAGLALDRVAADDFNGALAELDICCAAYPQEPDFLTRRALVLLALGRTREARATMERACAIDRGWADYVVRLADAGILRIPRDRVASLVDGLV